MLAEAPALIRDRYQQGAVFDAYLAAVAVFLFGAPGMPRWCMDAATRAHFA